MGITFKQMRAAAFNEAVRIETTQTELVRCGDRVAPDFGQLELKFTFLKICELIDLAGSDPTIKARLRALVKIPARESAA